jgi:multicomponent K+:H+ antiporter subunit A
MSFLAMVGGITIYYNRRHLFQFQSQFDEPDAKHIFEGVLQWIVNVSKQIISTLANGSLQRYIFLLLLLTLVMSALPLLDLAQNAGSRPQIPLDGVAITGALLMILSAIATVIWHRKRFIALIFLSVVGLVVSLVFAQFSAPDLALTQLSVEIVTIILLLLALFFLPQNTQKESSNRRLSMDLLVSALIGCVIGTICFAMLTTPRDTISAFFLENSKPGGGGTNVVNVILVDFRGFDTLGEITVLGIAALGIVKLISKMRIHIPTRDDKGRAWSNDPHPMMFEMVSQSLLPLAILVSVYIFLRGHNVPGGGFIAGLITSVAIIQQYIAHGVQWIKPRVKLDYQWIIAGGILMATATGLGSWIFGKPFLSTWFDYFDLPWIGEFELASAMLFDLGVYLTVVGSVLLILANLGKLTTSERVEVKENN